MGDIAHSVRHQVIKYPVIILRTGVKGKPVVHHGQKLIGTSFVYFVAPVGWLISISVGPWIHLDKSMLGVFPVCYFIVIE